MLELKLQCDDVDQARIYLNAQQYHNLLCDLYNALRGARKHGTDADVLFQIEHFMPDLAAAFDHHTGPY